MAFNQLSMGFIPPLTERQARKLQVIFIGSLAVGVFVVDWITPLGIGVGILYILVVLATLPQYSPFATKIATAGSILLILIKFLAFSDGPEHQAALINRGLSVFCILVTGIMVLRKVSSRKALQALKDDLEEKYSLRTKELKEQNLAMLNVLDDMERVKSTLEENERRLHLLIDAFPSGMLIVDQFGKVAFANKLIEILFGYSQQDLVGQSIDCLVPERFRHEHAQHRAGFLDSPSTRAMGVGRDLFARRKDGSEFPVEIGLNPVKTPEGFMVLSSIVDITARKQSEAQLEHLNQQLLEQNQELEAYAYAVSHDLRAPLRAIHNYADFLLEDLSARVSPDQREYLTGITTAVCEAEELVSDLLELSRLNIHHLTPQPCSIEAVVKTILPILNVGQDVHIQLPTTWPTVLGHDHLLKQIFQNLISNGIKFNKSSPKRIKVEWRPERYGFVRFSIHDNGIGIQAPYHEKIFEIFHRLHTQKDYEGTGIGLAIVKKAVNKLGGQIFVESEIGKGSVFSFTVPIGDT